MLIRRGRVIKIDALWEQRWHFERSCESPGIVTVRNKDGDCINLPGNAQEAKEFMEAYQKVIDEDISYSEYEGE